MSKIKFFSDKLFIKKNKKNIISSFNKVINSGNFILGNNVKKFENQFSKYLGIKNCITVASGTDAITIALKALEIKNNDEVITVSHTANATIAAIVSLGAKPVFIDIEKDFFTLDYLKIEKAISKKTKAILVVNLYGQSAKLDKILKVAKKYNIFLIEDCAQSNGSNYMGKKVGSFGIISCFSFYPTKNLGSFGDGGAIVTNNNKLAKKCYMLREYGWNLNRESLINGFCSRLDEIQANILLLRLKDLEKNNNIRKKLSNYYIRNLKHKKITLPKIQKNCDHVFHLFVIRVLNRDKLKKFLEKKGIQCLIHYPKPTHIQKAFNDYKKFDLRNTNIISKEILSLPLHLDLTKKDQDYIIKNIKNFFKNDQFK